MGTSPLICGANQWTGFYVTAAPVMKELNKVQEQSFPDVVFKIGVLENFAKFTGKHQGWSLFIIKLHA